MNGITDINAARYRRDHPEAAARIDALFDPLYAEMKAMNAELEDLVAHLRRINGTDPTIFSPGETGESWEDDPA